MGVEKNGPALVAPSPDPAHRKEGTVDTTILAEEATRGEAALAERLIEVYVHAYDERTRENRGFGLLDFEREAVEREARELYSRKVGAVT